MSIVEGVLEYILDEFGDTLGIEGAVTKSSGTLSTPYILLSTVTDERIYSHSGECAIFEAIIQLDVFDEDLKDAAQTAEALQEGLSGASGVMGDYVVDIVFVRNIREGNYPDGQLFRGMCQLEIKYRKGGV